MLYSEFISGTGCKDNEAYKAQRRTMKNLKESNKALRNRIKSLKWVLEA